MKKIIVIAVSLLFVALATLGQQHKTVGELHSTQEVLTQWTLDVQHNSNTIILDFQDLPNAQKVDVELFQVTGKRVKVWQEPLDDKHIELSHNKVLKPGLYIVKVMINGTAKAKKFQI